LVAYDVTDFDQCSRAFQAALQWSPTKSIDVVALMAGVVGEHGSLVDQIIKARDEQKVKEEATDKEEGDDEQEAIPPNPKHAALNVNLLGVYDSAYLALWYMGLDRKNRAEGRQEQQTATAEKEGKTPPTKSLILISSIVAYADAPMFTEYQTSKCESALPFCIFHPVVYFLSATLTVAVGVRGLFRSIRHSTLDGLDVPVRVNMLAPSFVRTPLMETVLPTLAAGAAGVEPGRGVNFVDMGMVVEAAARFAVDDTLHGQAWAIITAPNEGSKVVDLGDDDQGMWAGKALQDMLEEKKASGDLF
jgi:5'-hydroxyaverantin dehydrogenase